MSDPTNPLIKVRGGGFTNDEASVQDLLSWSSVTVNRTLSFSVAGTLSVASDVSPWVLLPTACTLLQRSRMAIKTMPTVTNGVSIDILRSTNNGATFSTILSANPTISVGGANQIIIPFGYFQVIPFNAGDILRMDILTVGDTVAGAGLTVTLNAFIPTS